MATETTSHSVRGLTVDRRIDDLRRQLQALGPFLVSSQPPSDQELDMFDAATERLIQESLGEASALLEAYAYAQVGEAAGLVNVPDEAPEGGATTQDPVRAGVNQRKRVIESCIAELEANRAAAAARLGPQVDAVIGPQVAHHMTPEPRSVHLGVTLREAGRRMVEWSVGSLLVTDERAYVGMVTDADLAREVVARGVDPAMTTVAACMRPPLTIESDRSILEAVRLMKDGHTRHLAVVDRGEIVGVISVSNILRYYSGVV